MHTISSLPRRIGFLAVLTLCGAAGPTNQDMSAQADGYAFAPVAFLGDPAPGGGTFLDVFESNVINNRGDVLFGSNVTADEEQGIFLRPRRVNTIAEIARVGEPAPGAGVFGVGFGHPTP